jgi:transcriptional regulator with XRE-family HTH domain
MLYLRKTVLKVTQSEMARITDASQATVSRWESGELEPDRRQLQAVRDAALAAGADWSDSWLLEAPKTDVAA